MTKIPDDVLREAWNRYANPQTPSEIGVAAFAAALAVAVEWARKDEREVLNRSVNFRLNERLCEMKPDQDDSIVGFNEAWTIVDAAIRARGGEQEGR